MKDDPAIRRLYVELTAHLVDREIAKFRRGEQAALVSFTNVAKLARNASKELTAPGARAHEPAMPACPRAASAQLESARPTQHQVATQLGVSNQQVHKIEKGINRVSAGRLLAIARVFDVGQGLAVARAAVARVVARVAAARAEGS